MATDSNIKVINEEYERVLGNPDNIIMSEGLAERMSAFTQEALGVGADSHDLYISFSEGVMDVAHVPGALHTLRHNSEESMSVSFEVSNVAQPALKKLHAALQQKLPVNIKLNGSGGFSCTGAEVSQWDLLKVAPHQFLLSITFGGKDVAF